MKLPSIEKILAALVSLVIIAVVIIGISVISLVVYHHNLSKEIDLLPYHQSDTIWMTKEQDVFIIVPKDADDTQTYVYWDGAYQTAIIGGVTRGRQFDLLINDHYLLAGAFHVYDDHMIVVPENDRPQVSDSAFLAGRKEIVFYRYDYETGSKMLPEEISSTLPLQK